MKKTSALAGQSRRILLVAADLPFRDGSVSALCEAGYCADGECDAELAWETLSRRGYELLIVDQQLRGHSGLRLVLRMSHANLTLPVILITEGAFLFDPQAHARLQAVTLLARPFDSERLIEIVQLTLPRASSAKPVQGSQALIERSSPSARGGNREALKPGQASPTPRATRR